MAGLVPAIHGFPPIEDVADRRQASLRRLRKLDGVPGMTDE
jgi:hypothetical protein